MADPKIEEFGEPISVEEFGQPLPGTISPPNPQAVAGMLRTSMPPPAPSKIIEELIAKEEAYKPQAYDDGLGNMTIGYGHLIKPTEKHLLGKTLTEKEARAMLQRDIEEHRNLGLRGVTVPLTPGQEAALTSLAFNVGPSHPTLKRIITHLNKGETQQAAALFATMNKGENRATGEMQEMEGLTTRRAKERALFLGELTPEAAVGKPAAPTATAAPAAAPSADEFGAPIDASEFGEPIPQQKDSDILGAFRSGVKEAVLPFSVERGDDAAVDTGGEIAASLTGNLAASLAAGWASAKAGAAIGTAVAPGAGTAIGGVVGGTVGTVLYGIYSGLGQEKIRSERAGQEFSPIRAVTQAGLQINPVFKASSKAEKLVRIGAQAVGEYATEKSYGGDTTTALTAGALGVLGTAFIGKKQTIPAVTGGDDVAKKMIEGFANDGGVIQRTQKFEQSIERVPLQAALENDDFKRFVLSQPGTGIAKSGKKGRNLDKAFQRELKTLGTSVFSSKSKIEELNDMWHTYKASQAAVAEMNTELAKKLAGKEEAGKAAEAFQKDMDINIVTKELVDSLYVAKTIDDRIGSNMEGQFAKYGASKERFTVMSHGILKSGEEASIASAKAGLSNKDMGAALTGKPHLLTPEARAKLATEEGQNALQLWRNTWDSAHESLESLGVKVNYRANYMPMRQLRGSDLAVALDRYASDIADSMDTYGATKFSAFIDQLDEEADADLISKIQELVSLGNRIGKPVDSLADIKFIKDEALKGGGKLAANTQIGAAYERGVEELSDSLRDFDVGKNLIAYINGNLKNAILAPRLRELSMTADMLDGLKMTNSADWVRHRIGVMSGAMRGGDALVLGMQQRYTYAAQKMMNSSSAAARRTGKTLDAAGDFAGFLTSRYYPAFLGGNIRAALRNTTQPFMQAAPELGQIYGTKLVATAQLMTARKMAGGAAGKVKRAAGQLAGEAPSPIEGTGVKGAFETLMGRSNIEQELHEFGLTSRYYTADGLLDENRLQSINKVVKGLDDTSMFLFSKADQFNRHSTLNIGRLWAKDLVEGNKDALKALSRAGTGLKQSLAGSRLLEKAKTDTVARAKLEYELAHYLNQKTQFLYGKEFHSKALADAGRAFAMFTKWPSIMASDAAYMLAKRDWEQMRRRFLMPTAITVLAQSVIESEERPGMKYAIGDLTDLSPIGTFKNVDRTLSGGPIIQSGVKAVKGLADIATTPVQEMPEKLRSTAKGLAKQAATVYTPAVSSIINEADRWQKAFGNESLSDKLFPEDDE